MSDDERDKVFAAVTEFQSAKAADEYIEGRVARTAAAYRVLSDSLLSAKAYRPRIVSGKLQVQYSREPFSAADLLNEAELTLLLTEREKSEERRRVAQAAKTALGID